MKYLPVELLVLGLLLFSCAGPNRLTDAAEDPAAESVEELLPEYVEFDSTPYEEDPPLDEPIIVHDAPAALLSGALGRWGFDTLQGFRIQILSTRQKAEADLMASEATAWWLEQQESGELTDIYPTATATPPVYQDFRPPYYRVRLGDFLSREEADRVLSLVEAQFESAFIAPDRVEREL